MRGAADMRSSTSIRGMVLNRESEGQQSAGEIAFQAAPDRAKPDPQSPITAEQAAPPAEGGINGSGVSAPVPIYKRDPDYSEEAGAAPLWGTVLLSTVVGADG